MCSPRGWTVKLQCFLYFFCAYFLGQVCKEFLEYIPEMKWTLGVNRHVAFRQLNFTILLSKVVAGPIYIPTSSMKS